MTVLWRRCCGWAYLGMRELESALVCFLHRAKDHDQKGIWLILPSHNPPLREAKTGTLSRWGPRGRNRIRPRKKATYFSLLASFLFLYMSWLPAPGWHCPQWGGPFLIVHLSGKHPTGSGNRMTSSQLTLSSLDDPASVRLTKINK